MSAPSPLRRSRPTAAHLTKFYFAFHQDSRIEQDDQFVLEKWIDESWSEALRQGCRARELQADHRHEQVSSGWHLLTVRTSGAHC